MELEREDHDAVEFVELVERIVSQAAESRRPRDIYVVHLDNWFGDRWCQFSGKILGIAGVRGGQLTVPPFHPRRVRSQSRYRCGEDGSYQLARREPNLHRYQTSSANLYRWIANFSTSAMFVWYSGNSVKNGAGSLMVYHVHEGRTEYWYASFQKTASWSLTKTVGISPETLLTCAQV